MAAPSEALGAQQGDDEIDEEKSGGNAGEDQRAAHGSDSIAKARVAERCREEQRHKAKPQ